MVGLTDRRYMTEILLLRKQTTQTALRSFQATIDGRFAPPVMLVDEDAESVSMVTHFNKAVTEIAAELHCKHSRKSAFGYPREILYFCDQRCD